MAFVANDQSEEEDQKNQQGNAPTGGAVHLAPSSGTVSGSGAGSSGAASGTPSQPATPAGGSFASLNDYITANQGQAQPLADKLTPGINKQYSDLDSQNNSAIASINNQVKSAPGYTANNPDALAAESADPVSFANDPNNVKMFQSLLQDTYGGPTSAESTNDYANQQTAINNAIATGTANTTTEAGRSNLLAQNEASPTAGVTALNSAILTQDPNALGSVENAYKPFGNLITNLNTGAQNVNQTIASQQADAAAAKAASNKAITDQISALNSGVTGAASAAQQKAAAQNAQIKSDLAAGNLTSSDLAAMGLTPDQWNALSAAGKAAATSQVVRSNQGQFGANTATTNIDLTPFLTQTDPNTAITAANVATPQQYQQAQAFQSLLNGLNLQTPSMILNPNASASAGTAPSSLNSFDYNTALNTANNTIADEKASAQAYVDALQSGADESHAEAAATQAARQNKEKQAEATSMIGLPVAIASSLPGIGKPISNAVDTVVQFFCFHPDTLVEMADGTLLPISRIEVGAYTRGGLVLATSRAIGYDYYWYKGVLVTGKHAVKEDGKWIRVESSPAALRMKGFTEIVCSLTTAKHRIWANGVEFADERETDDYENLTIEQSLEVLNRVDVG